MRKLAIALSLLAIVPFALAACGGDDDEEEPAAPTTTEEEPAGDGAGGGGAGGAAETVEIAADPGGDIAYVQDALDASAGDLTFELTNDSSTPHDFVIEDQDGNEITRTDVITGDTDTTMASLEPGEYTFFCSVNGHRELGMEGPLTVK